MGGRLDPAPPSLPKLIRHTGVAFERVAVLRGVFEPVPTTQRRERNEINSVSDGLHRIVLHHALMQTLNMPSELRDCAALGLTRDLSEAHCSVSSIDLLAGHKRGGMPLWRDKLFVFLARNTQGASTASHIPIDQQMTVGLRIGI